MVNLSHEAAKIILAELAKNQDFMDHFTVAQITDLIHMAYVEKAPVIAGEPDYEKFETDQRKTAGRQWIGAMLDMVVDVWASKNVGPYVHIAVAGFRGARYMSPDQLEGATRHYKHRVGVDLSDAERVIMNLVVMITEFPVEGEETESKTREMIKWIRDRHRLLGLDREALDSLSMVLLTR